jgi:hypothetical protein
VTEPLLPAWWRRWTRRQEREDVDIAAALAAARQLIADGEAEQPREDEEPDSRLAWVALAVLALAYAGAIIMLIAITRP